MDKQPIIQAAKKSFLAMKDPYNSVERVFPGVLDFFKNGTDYFYVGVKDKPQIPLALVDQLWENGNYLLHTIDKASIGGRAVDMQRVNPISGRPMTGSSSGTAINVLLGINDLGIGTDGGGSVLAPAMAVNLFGFISKLIAQEHTSLFQSLSTDQIAFSPSIGYMTRTYLEMLRAIRSTLDLAKAVPSPDPIGVLGQIPEELGQDVKRLSAPDRFGPREPLVHFLEETLPQHGFLISLEGPVDYAGMGDSVLGHMGNLAQEGQRRSGKGLIRAVNMAGATALTVPAGDFAKAYVLICESDLSKIQAMLAFAEKLAKPQDVLLERYFSKFENYFPENFHF